MTIVWVDGTKMTGLSSDTKPTLVPNNTEFFETDTLKLYSFNGTSWVRTNATQDEPVIPYTIVLGDYTQPTTAVATSEVSVSEGSADTVVDNGQTGGVGAVWFGQITGLTVGHKLVGVTLKSGSPAPGSVRVGVYNESGGVPNTLLAESASTSWTAGTNASQRINFTDTSQEVPSGGVVWVAMQHSSNDMRYLVGSTSGRRQLQGFGAFPSTASSTASEPNFFQTIHYEIESSGVATKAVDDNTGTRSKTNSEVNPAIYVDMNAPTNICGIAIRPHVDTDATEIKIRVDTDTTFADANNARVITYSSLTESNWNYIRFNPIVGRYIQIYVTDGSAKTLAVEEIKVLTRTDSGLLAEHEHFDISTSDTSLGLDGS